MRRGERFYAHRVACEIAHGPIREGLNALHHCDNPPCCNGAHLFPGTQLDNVRDMWSKGRARPRRGPRPDLIGELHGRAKLNAEKVRRIRLLRADELTLDEIADVIGVGKSTISRVINEEQRGGWAHVR